MSLLDFLFPKQSLGGREGAWVTEGELEGLTLRSRVFETSELKGRGIKSLDRVFAMGGYRDSRLLKDAIHTFKYRRIPGVGEFLAGGLVEALGGRSECGGGNRNEGNRTFATVPVELTQRGAACPEPGRRGYPRCVNSTFADNSCLCPIPLHFLRKFWRGFNQAAYLAERVGKTTGVPVRHLLKRVRPTGHQAKRGKKDRWKALRGAFRMRSNSFDVCETVYLVDDVFTTGATLEECARVLKESGVPRVEAVVLAYD